MENTELEQARIDAFIEEYCRDFNGNRAAKKFGLKRKQAFEILRREDVKAEVNRLIAEKRARSKIEIATVEGMLRDLAELDPLDLFDENGDLRDLIDIPPPARRAIKSIRRTTAVDPDGRTTATVHVETWDKKAAIELLGKHRKMFSDRLELDGNVGTTVNFTIKGLEDPIGG